MTRGRIVIADFPDVEAHLHGVTQCRCGGTVEVVSIGAESFFADYSNAAVLHAVPQCDVFRRLDVGRFLEYCRTGREPKVAPIVARPRE